MIEMNNNFKLRTKKIKQQDIKIATGNDLFKIKQIIYSFEGKLFKTIMKQIVFLKHKNTDSIIWEERRCVL